MQTYVVKIYARRNVGPWELTPLAVAIDVMIALKSAYTSREHVRHVRETYCHYGTVENALRRFPLQDLQEIVTYFRLRKEA